MKKRKLKKIALNRETLRMLENVDLPRVGGGYSVRTECGSCPASACHPTFCPFTTCSNDC
jgi:hypothetical protein